MRIGIRDVARLAGVSTATVSRVMGGGTVSDGLRAQVQDAVRASGYRPNLSARRLRSRDTGTIGLILADIRNPFFTTLSRTVEAIAYRQGRRVILCNTDEDHERELLYLRLMEEERVTGIIFAPTNAALDRPDALPAGIPAVLVDRARPDAPFDAVVLDNRDAARALVAHLVAHGSRKLAGLFGADCLTGNERRDGFEFALAAHGLPARSVIITPGTAEAEAATAALLRDPDPPDAILATDGRSLMGVLRAARADGIAIPARLALAGFDDEDWTSLVEPALTVVAQPVERIATAAMRLLSERLADPALPPRRVVLAGHCIARGSTLRLLPMRRSA